ncbi:hypothetical protein F5X99DRAFT_335784 [Biscogniauxia marginata]|nr:hypothetical protein F5X99DRAFT_335784 [Biscogniauxia marginata]
MCLFPFPAQPPKSKKSRKTKNPASSEDIRETTRKAIDEAVGQMFPTVSPYPAVTPGHMLRQNHIGYDMDYWLEENQHAHVTRGQWNEHKETLKNAHNMIGTNGNKIDDLRDAVCGEVEVTQNAIKETHDSVKDARGAIKDTQDAVKGTQDAIKSTHDAIIGAHEDIKSTREAIQNTHNEVKEARKTMKESHSEQVSKHADCAAEVDKVRKLLEDEAKKRDEAHLRQQTMQEAWNYVQSLRQADRDANQLSRSSSRSTSSRSGGSRRRHKAPEDPVESERRRQREREAEESLVERLGRLISEAEKSNKDNRNREGDSRYYGYGPGSSPPWPGADGWEYRGGTWHYFPSQQNYFYDDFDTGDTGGYVPPYRRPFRHGASGGGPSWEQHRRHR